MGKSPQKMQIIDTKTLLPRRMGVRRELAEEIHGLRLVSKVKHLPPAARKRTLQKAALLAKAFRNSQRKNGVVIAEERRALALAIKERRAKTRAK